jgi:hypothetical protein
MKIEKATKGADELWDKFCQVFAIDPAVYGRGRANKEVSDLRKAGITAADLEWWAKWFRTYDRGGKSGNAPSLPIFRLTWGAAKTKRTELVKAATGNAPAPVPTPEQDAQALESPSYLKFQFESWRDTKAETWWEDLSGAERAERIEREKAALSTQEYFRRHPMGLEASAMANAKSRLAEEKSSFKQWLKERENPTNTG